jgi:hypothetical protein
VKLTVRTLSLVFVAGCWGAVLNGLAIWLFGMLGLTSALGVKIAPALTAAFIYPRLVWGGLWGFLFLLPAGRQTWPIRGLIFSLAPTLVQVCLVFPYQTHKGFLGLELGYLTPVMVLFYNAIWGLGAGFWLKGARPS